MQTFFDRGGGWVTAQGAILLAWVAAATQRAGVPGPVRIVGWMVAVAGATLAAAGLRGLGRNLTPYPEPLAGGSLVDRGVYGVVRHPIYGGLAVGAAGLGLGLGSLGATVVGLILLGFFAVKARQEERRLEATYPGYAGYRERVRAMLVPWLL